MGDLIRRILLLDWIGEQSLLHIIADHGTGHILKPQVSDALIYIFGCLLQIKTHIRDLMVSRETKSAHGAGNCVCHLLIHTMIILVCVIIVNTKLWHRVFRNP